MKKLAAILCMIFIAIFPSDSFSEDHGLEITGALSGSYANAYIGCVPGSTAYDGSVYQGDLEIDFKIYETIFYLELWNSYSPHDGANKDWGDEIDYITGVKKKIGEFSFDLSYMYYNFANLKNTEGDLHAIYLNMDFQEIMGIIPYVTIEGDIPQDKDVLEGGMMYRAGMKYSPKFFGQPIDMDLSIGGHDGAYGTRKEIVSSVRGVLSTTVDFKIINVTPQISYQKRVGYSVEHGGLTENKFWYGITMSIPFTIYQKK